MTHFLFSISTKTHNLQKIVEFFPQRMKCTQVIEKDNFKAIIGDFESSNFVLSKNENYFKLLPNITKYINFNIQKEENNLGHQEFQPVIEIDMENREIKITTDALGTDFIYFAINKNNIYISSHMKYMLCNDHELLEELDYDALLEYVFSHCILGMKTFFTKIKLLPYNRHIRLKFNDLAENNLEKILLSESSIAYNFPKAYSNVKKSDYNKIVEEQAQIFQKYFSSLLQKHKENNYFLLSGGLDSRSLIASLRKEDREKSKALTFDYSLNGPNLTIAQEVTEILGITHLTKIISSEETVEDALKHMWYGEGVSTHVASRLIKLLKESKTENNVFIDGYLGDTQLGGEFFTCIKNKQLREEPNLALLLAMQKHNYFFPTKIFSEIVLEQDILNKVILPELHKHTQLLWNIEDKRMKIEVLLALTRGRKYTLGGPKTVEIFGTTVLPFYHPHIFEHYIKIPYKLREKRKFELDVLAKLNPELAKLRTTSSKFKRLKIVQTALKIVRWIEKKMGITVIPKSSSPINMWTDKESAYYRFVNQFLEDKKSFIWNILNEDNVKKQFNDLFNNKNHLELFLSAIIDLEIMMRLFYGINLPEKITIKSSNLGSILKIKPEFRTYNIEKEIYDKK
ncbi:MAG: hypothetical protein KGD64_09830 [Candidatus Heimdallarchaeota archaeon]|nr:hypothetical protein [Candidatus Heimdallarchaeota archaeon]